jgi:hypothetical protein
VDDERFDAVSRVLGERATRRGALGVLAGLAGLLGVEIIEATSKRRRSKRSRAAEVEAERAVASPCTRLCNLFFPVPRRLRGICLANCECFRRCLAIADPVRRDACLRAAVSDPRFCTAPAVVPPTDTPGGGFGGPDGGEGR